MKLEVIYIYKLALVFCKYDLWKYYFTNRVVHIWNSLPNSVDFWQSYDFVYDYKAQSFSTGSQK